MFKFISVALICAIIISLQSKAQNMPIINNFNESQQKSLSQYPDTSQCDMENCFCDSDPTPAGIMISHVHNKGEWMASYRFMQMKMQGNVMGNQAIDTKEVLSRFSAAGENMNMKMHMLMLMYGINERLTVMGMFHYNSNYMEMMMKQGDRQHSHAMKTNGSGDTKLSALYALVKKERAQLIVNTGVTIPTGAYNLKGKPLDGMYPNARLPYNMQLGCGTWDILPGITYIIKQEKFSFSSQLNSILRVKNNLVGYRLGNEYNLNVWSAYNWLPSISNSLRIEANYAERIKNSDSSLPVHTEPAANKNNYGGKTLNVYFGTVIHLKKGVLSRFYFGAEFGLPLYQNLNGIQMPLKQNLIINSSFKF